MAMARPLRLEYEGAVYHVTSRGNEKANVFRDERDRTRFLEILGLVATASGWLVHAWCLMGNHYDLVVETPRGNLSSGMQRINGRYTQWFNIRHRRSGHLFQGRYKAILVERETHLLELCRYVVLNPVRTGTVPSASAWAWSSYRATAGRSPAPRWLDVDGTLSRFAKSKSRARELYRRFVAEGRAAPSPIAAVRHQAYLGGDEFLKEVDARLKGAVLAEDIPRGQRFPAPVAIETIRRAVALEFGVEPASLSRRRGGEDKMAAVCLSRRLSGLTGVEIARAFGIKPARVSNIVTEIEIGKRPRLAVRLRRIEARLVP